MNKFLKILGLVVAVHVVVLLMMFVNPGCRSTSQRSAPSAADTAPPADAAAVLPADASAPPVPAVSINIPSSAAVRYSPTRPGTPASSALESAPPTDVTPVTTYTVVSGDSLWKIAHKHGTTQLELEHANHLTGSSRLSVGQKLIIPGKAPSGVPASTGGAVESPAGIVYVARGGDTLASIAHHAGTTSAELKKYNHLKSDYVQVGQELRLPPGSPMAAERPLPGAPTAPAPTRKADGSVVHVVKAGETIGAIARKYQVKAQDLLVANNIGDPKKIRAGQELVIPGATGATPAVSPSPASPAAAPGLAPATSVVPPPEQPTTTVPPPNQDLDAGLKPQGNVPVIKVDDANEPPKNP